MMQRAYPWYRGRVFLDIVLPVSCFFPDEESWWWLIAFWWCLAGRFVSNPSKMYYYVRICNVTLTAIIMYECVTWRLQLTAAGSFSFSDIVGRIIHALFRSSIAPSSARSVLTVHYYSVVRKGLSVARPVDHAVTRRSTSSLLLLFLLLLYCLPTMCRASFIQNEKVDTIRRIPPITSNQFSFPAHCQFNTNNISSHEYWTVKSINTTAVCTVHSVERSTYTQQAVVCTGYR